MAFSIIAARPCGSASSKPLTATSKPCFGAAVAIPTCAICSSKPSVWPLREPNSLLFEKSLECTVCYRFLLRTGNRILVGVQTARLHARQVEINVREGPTTPAQRQMGAACGAVHVDDDFFQQRTEQLLAIAIRGGRCRPDFPEISTKREEFLFLFRAQRARALLLSPVELRFGGGQIAQPSFPFAFQSAGHEPILGFDHPILTLGPFGVVP